MTRNPEAFRNPGVVAFFLAVSLLGTAPGAHAAFVGGLETFDGVVKDTLTWEETIAGVGSSVTQDDAMEMEGIGAWVDYTTTFTVGIGESVEVEITDFGTPFVGSIRILLTTNSGGTSAPAMFDDGYVGIDWNAAITRFLTCVGAGGGCSGLALGPVFGPSDPEPHIVRIHRTSLTSVTCTLIRKSDASVLGTAVTPVPASLPANLHLSLLSAGTGLVVFDDVSIPSLVDRCGDGVPDARFGEECDDGNTVSGDGCSAECALEFCGDGIVQPAIGEQCDDGNTVDGDCCSAACAFDALGTPCDDATVCNGAETCNGAGSCQVGMALDCDDGDLCTLDTCDPTLGCENTGEPWQGCVDDFAVGVIVVKENAPGKEKILAKLKRLGTTIVQDDFGDPVSGDTAYAVCLFDDEQTLVGSLNVDRAGASCAGKSCWKQAGLGWKYGDKDAAAAGVSKMRLVGGPSGKGQVQVKAANNAKKGQDAMPVGVAASLVTAASVRVQLVGSDAPQCFEATLDQIKRQEPDFFKAIRK